MNNKTFRHVAMTSIAAAISIVSQGSFAHTRLQVPAVNSGAGGVATYNNVATVHGCHNDVTNSNSTPVIATSVVFPDQTATVQTRAAGAADPFLDSTETLDTYVEGGAVVGVDKVKSKDVFGSEDVKRDDLGNVIGFYAKDGSLPGLDYISLLPFRASTINIPADSCAASVTYVLAIADICKVTRASQFADTNVNLWTPAVGSTFDGPGLHGFNSPATYRINRTAPLPAECGAGVDVRVVPTAAQINRDLPIMVGNKQYWPVTGK